MRRTWKLWAAGLATGVLGAAPAVGRADDDFAGGYAKPAVGGVEAGTRKPIRTAVGAPELPAADKVATRTNGLTAVADLAKRDAAEAAERVAAVRVLGAVDCRYFPDAEAALIAALRTDAHEPVRFEAASVLGRGCCSTMKILDALEIAVAASERDGHPGERSDRVRAAAARGLEVCLPWFAEPRDRAAAKPMADGVLTAAKAGPDAADPTIDADQLAVADRDRVARAKRTLAAFRAAPKVGTVVVGSACDQVEFPLEKAAPKPVPVTPVAAKPVVVKPKPVEVAVAPMPREVLPPVVAAKPVEAKPEVAPAPRPVVVAVAAAVEVAPAPREVVAAAAVPPVPPVPAIVPPVPAIVPPVPVVVPPPVVPAVPVTTPVVPPAPVPPPEKVSAAPVTVTVPPPMPAPPAPPTPEVVTVSRTEEVKVPAGSTLFREVVIKLYTGPTPADRHAAIREIVKLDPAEHAIVRPLIARAKFDPAEAVRVDCIRHIVAYKLATPEVVGELDKLSTDKNEWVRAEAAKAVAELRAKK